MNKPWYSLKLDEELQKKQTVINSCNDGIDYPY